jgi:hypothetical protein
MFPARYGPSFYILHRWKKTVFMKNAMICNAGLLARSQFESGRSCDETTRSRFLPWFSSVLEQILSCYPNSTLHCKPHSPSNVNIQLSSYNKKYSRCSPLLTTKLLLHLPTLYPPSSVISTRRTSGHCLRTVNAGHGPASRQKNKAIRSRTSVEGHTVGMLLVHWYL